MAANTDLEMVSAIEKDLNLQLTTGKILEVFNYAYHTSVGREVNDSLLALTPTR